MKSRSSWLTLIDHVQYFVVDDSGLKARIEKKQQIFPVHGDEDITSTYETFEFDALYVLRIR